MTMKLLSLMRVHSDITCLHPVSKDIVRDFSCAVTPRTFELSFSHSLDLFVSVSVSQLLVFAMLQEHMNYSVLIAFWGFQASGSKRMTPTAVSALSRCVKRIQP